MIFTTPGRLKPSGDINLQIRIWNVSSFSVNGRACGSAGSSTSRSSARSGTELPSGQGFGLIWVEAQSAPANIIPLNEKWSASFTLQDGDLTNNRSSARVYRP